MKFFYAYFVLLLSLSGCQNREKIDLNSLRKNFIKAIFESEIEESPFNLSYRLKTVFFSDEIVSLFGSFDEYTNLPHGHGFYEGQTYYRVKGKWKPVSLNNLFNSKEQTEFLRSYCEKDLKTQHTYFSDCNHTTLALNAINTFVINRQALIIVFQPYIAGSYPDGPFVVKIPFERLKNEWNRSHPFISLLETTLSSKSFIASWEEEEFQESIEISQSMHSCLPQNGLSEHH